MAHRDRSDRLNRVVAVQALRHQLASLRLHRPRFALGDLVFDDSMGDGLKLRVGQVNGRAS
jgi:hypothetical protein